MTGAFRAAPDSYPVTPAPPAPELPLDLSTLPPPVVVHHHHHYGPPPTSATPPPSIALTVIITLLFNLWGLIPAFVHSRRAADGGHPTRPYWKAFWLSLLVPMVLGAVALIGFFALFWGVAVLDHVR